MTRATLRQLKRTHGIHGVPALRAIPGPHFGLPAVEDESGSLDDVLDACLPAERTVDGEPTPLHRALLDAMTNATTWRA